MAETYSDFADVYDEFMDNAPYEVWCENIVQIVEEFGVSKPVRGAKHQPDQIGGKESEWSKALASERDLVLDLGCGTGTLTELLSNRGYDMIGVDNSSAMLNIAMRKREESGAQILYLLQDMRELELYSTVGTVVSVCDSLNYILEEEELLEVFRLVNNYLYPGGIFVFDFNTDYKYREVIGDTTIAENREECSFIWDNYYDDETGINEYDVTVFVREDPGRGAADGEGLFRRFSETHMQRGYTIRQMRNLVEQAGMRILKIMDADSLQEASDLSERVYIVAGECEKTENGQQAE